MSDKQDKLHQSILVGWVCALQLVVIMFVVSLIRAAIANDFTWFAKDPGNLGLDIMIVVFSIYAVIPVLMKIFDGKVFRWLLVAAAIFFFLMFIAHQLTHMYVDKMPLNIYHVLDFCHHGVLLWVTVRTVQWARLASPQDQSSRSPMSAGAGAGTA